MQPKSTSKNATADYPSSPQAQYDAYRRGERLLLKPIQPPASFSGFYDQDVHATFLIALATIALGFNTKSVLQSLNQGLTESDFVQHMATFCAKTAGATETDLQKIWTCILESDTTLPELCEDLAVIMEDEPKSTPSHSKQQRPRPQRLRDKKNQEKKKIVELERRLLVETLKLKKLELEMALKNSKEMMVRSCELVQQDVFGSSVGCAKFDEYVDLALKHWEKMQPTKTEAEHQRRRWDCQIQLMKMLKWGALWSLVSLLVRVSYALAKFLVPVIVVLKLGTKLWWLLRWALR
ncbi:hypothetical protein H2200_009690 [Cladophialophora chaetospira]|uniref:Uncharacterized protein n=1 Tax=Cladophialophora chaetospira TaxID=386627 RepID=A0AA39CF06_9EURO|nr:hypothetical protein H2200_009690 [Cladophialophora chaetospira]